MKLPHSNRLFAALVAMLSPGVILAAASVGDFLQVPMGNAGGYFEYRVREDAAGLYADLAWAQDTGDLKGTLRIPATVTIKNVELPVRGINVFFNINRFLKCSRVEVPSSALDHWTSAIDDGVDQVNPAWDIPLTEFEIYATTAGNGCLSSEILRGLRRLRMVSIAGVRVVQTNLFNASSFESLTFAPGLESIDARLIKGYRSTSDFNSYSVALPSTVTNIGLRAFYDCGRMSACTVESPFFNIGEGAFAGCTALPLFAVPTGTVRIADYAFNGCCPNGLITLPDSVTEIGMSAFNGSHVASFPPNVSKVGTNAFWKATIDTVALPQGLTSVPPVWFEGATIASLTISDSVTSIGTDAFAMTSCDALTVGAGLANVSKADFRNVRALTVNGSGTTVLPAEAFRGEPVESVSLTGAASLGTYAFAGTPLTSFSGMPAGLTTLPEGLFKDCASLTRFTDFGSVTEIGTSAFEHSGLTSLDLPDGLTTIGSRAYANCASLFYAEIPASVTSIAEDAFAGTPISVVVMKGAPPAGLASAGLPAGAHVLYPEALSDAWDEVSAEGLTFVKRSSTGEFAPPDVSQNWAARTDIYAHCGPLTADETWAADKVHVVYGWVTVPYGKTLTLASNAIVKFCPNTGIFLEGGSCTVERISAQVYFTSIHDDESIVGGDTDGDGGAIEPGWGEYAIWGEIGLKERIIYRCFEDPASYLHVGMTTEYGGCNYTVREDATDGLYLEFAGSQKNLGDASLTIPEKIDVEGKGILFPVLSFADTSKNGSWSRLNGKSLQLPSAIFRHSGLNQFQGFMTGALTIYKSDDRAYSIPPQCFLNNRFTSVALNGISRLEGDRSNGGPFASMNTLKTLALGSDLEYIGYRTFSYCTELTAINLPPSVKVLEERAFENCRAVTSLNLGQVESIGTAAIGCELIAEISIPDSVTNLAEYAFDGCSGLRTVTIGTAGSGLPIASLMPFPWNIEHLVVNGNGETMFGSHSHTSWGTYKLQDVALHGVKAITNNFSSSSTPFNNCPSLRTITADEALTDICNYAFDRASALESFVVPDSVTRIGDSAFEGCWEMTNIVIGSGVTSIGRQAFNTCRKLTDVIIPDSVTEIGLNAFSGCTGLRKLTFGSGYKRIQSQRFPRDAEFELFVNGDGTTVIEGGAFQYSKIKRAVLRGVQYLGNEGEVSSTASYGAPFSDCKLLESVELGEGLVQLGRHCFSACTSLRSITLPSSVKVVGAEAFSGCAALEHIDLSNAEVIGNSAFNGCRALENLTIPNTVTNVGESVFDNCSSLTNLVINNRGGQIHSGYQTPAVGGTVTINGDGETVIGNRAFESSKVRKFVMNGVKSIQDGSTSYYSAFRTTDIEEFVIGEGLEYIGRNAFSGSKNLTEITLPDSVTDIANSAFSACSALSRVRLGEGLGNIASSAFSGDKQIQYMEIPASVTNIGASAFTGIENLTLFFDGLPIPQLGQISDSYNDLTIVRPSAYSNEWAEAEIPSRIKVVPEPEEGVTWTPDTNRDWANCADVYAHKGVVAANEVWSADKTHVIYGWVTVTNGVTVTVEPGAVVKFCTGMGAIIKSKGKFIIKGVTLTHVFDDLVGGDSDGDFGTRTPTAGAYTIYGYPVEDESTVYRARIFHHAGSLPESEVWPGDYNVHYLDGDFTIPQETTLTLEKGAIVKVSDGTKIIVSGGLYARGSRGEKVYVTSSHDDEVGGDSDGIVRTPVWADWHYISVNPGGEVEMDHAVIRYCCNRVSFYSDYGAIVVGTGGSVTLRNCTVSDCFTHAIYNEGRFSAANCIFFAVNKSLVSLRSVGELEMRNCVAYDCAAIANRADLTGSKNRFGNCIFHTMHSWLSSSTSEDAACETSPAVAFDHCCFWNRLDGSEVCEMAGTDGNIHADPELVSPGYGDFRIHDTSPCIDAGGALGPELDFYGQPRQNALTEPTGEPDAKGRYRDIGVYEVIPLDGVLDAPDLEVANVTVSPKSFKVGDTVKVRYRVTNVSDENDALDPRRDRLELVGENGIAYDLGLVWNETALPCGGAVAQACEAQVTVPPMPVGEVRARVTINSERDLFEGVATANNRAQSGQLSLAVSERCLDPGETTSFVLTPKGTASYRLVGDIPADTLLHVLASKGRKLIVRTCAEATPSDVRYDREAEQIVEGSYLLSLVEGSQYVTFENTSEETQEVTVRRFEAGFSLISFQDLDIFVNTNYDGPLSGPMIRTTLTNTAARLGWQNVVDRFLTNTPVVAALRYYGNCFKDEMTVALVSDDVRIEPTFQQVCSRNYGYARFDLFGQKPGLYRLEIAQDGVTRSKDRLYLYDPHTYLYETDYNVFWSAVGLERQFTEEDPDAIHENPMGIQVRISSIPTHIKTDFTYRPKASWRAREINGEVEVPWLRLSSKESQIRLSNDDRWDKQIDLILLARVEPKNILQAGEGGSFPFEFRALREVKVGEKPKDPLEDTNGFRVWSGSSEGTDYLAQWREELRVWRDHGVRIQSVVEPAATNKIFLGYFATSWYFDLRGQLIVQEEPKYDEYVFKSLEDEPYPWEANEAHSRPVDGSDELWGIVQAQMRTLYGDTWGSWKRRLVNRACRFADCCRERPWMVLKKDIVQADLARISRDDPFVPTLATGKDAFLPGRGIPLAVTRRYGSGLSSRFADGMFGHGWSSWLDARLYRKNDKQIVIGEPGQPKDIFVFEEESRTWKQEGGLTKLDGNRQTYEDGSSREFDDDGYLVKLRDSRDRGVTVEYDDAHHVTRVVHTDGASLRFVYAGDVVSEIYATPRAEGEERLQARYAYETRDGRKLLTEVFGYDGRHQIFEYAPADATPSSLAMTRAEMPGLPASAFGWDADGRLATITVGDTLVTEFQREGDIVRMIDPQGGVTTAELGPAGQFLSITDPENQTIAFDYDNHGRLPVGVTLPSRRRIKLTYAASRKLLEVVSPSDAVTRYEYAKCGKLAKLIDAESQARRYTYNGFGEVVSAASPENFGYRNTYDEETGDCVKTRFYGEQAGYDATYDERGLRTGLTSVAGERPIAYAYNDVGALTEVRDRVGGDIVMTCDATNRITRFEALGRAYNLSYDGYRGISALVDDNGAGERTVYDGMGRLVRVEDAQDPNNVYYACEYDPTSGVLTKETFGTNDVTCTYEVDGHGLVTRLLNKRQSSTVVDLAYQYSPDGVITSIVDQANQRKNFFDYDKDGQLVQASYSSVNRTENFGYDAVGNRKGLTASVRLDPGTGRVTSIGDVADSAFGTFTFGYDEYGRLNEVVNERKGIEWRCVNDALGSRVKISTGGKLYERVTLPGTNLLLDEYEDGVRIRHHIYANGRRVATITPNGVRYLISDQVGSVRCVFNERGVLTGSAEFGAWGDVLRSEGADAGLCGWCAAYGVETDPTGLHWMFNRYYSARLGRFLNEDPIGLAGGDVNLRRYCMNSPVGYYDPLGLSFGAGMRYLGAFAISAVAWTVSVISLAGGPVAAAAGGMAGSFIGTAGLGVTSALTDTPISGLDVGIAVAGDVLTPIGLLSSLAEGSAAATATGYAVGGISAKINFYAMLFSSFAMWDAFLDCP